MIYYKIIKDNEFVGIGTSYDLRVFQDKHNILLVSDENNAQYIQYNEILYRDNWFKSVTNNNIQYEIAEISVIEEEEYQQLFEAIDKGEEIIIEEQQDNYIEESIIIDPATIITVDFLKNEKIKETSYICNQIITNGFDIELSDNKNYHFSLTIQDQLNLITLSAMIANGETEIPYHADGQLCKIFSVEDMGNVIQTATMFKTYHITYYNSLKSYIQSLETKEDIREINYGMNIPNEYQSDVLKELIRKMNTT